MTDQQLLFIDLETYSSVPVTNGVYRYTEADDFQILMAAWATQDDALLGTVHVAIGAEEIAAIPGLDDPAVVKVAHYAQFERVCISRFLGMPVGEYQSPRQYLDTMALAAEWGYPRSLEKLAHALGAEEKDTAGTRLINLFCTPNRKTGKRVLPEEKPAEWKRFVEYCRQDVATLVDVYGILMDRHGGWPTAAEAELYVSDQRINDEGIPVDLDMAARAVEASEANAERDLQAMKDLTGQDNPNSNTQLMGWFGGTGLPLPNLQKATVEETLRRDDLDPDHREALELRQQLALVAAKKYIAATDRTNSDGRLRGSLQFFGAHTGRWAGRGVQLQNLPSNTLESETDKDLLDLGLISEEEMFHRTEDYIDSAITELKAGTNPDANTLKALVRSMFVGPFTVVDFAAIEARVVAWLAGEEWALQAFRDGRDIYVETAQRMGGLTRKEGKVAVLALGYNGGTGSLAAMGAEGDKRQLQFLVNQWREANPAIVNLWGQMGDAFVNGGQVGEFLSIERDGDSRYMRLPSGRVIAYHGCKRVWENDPYGGRKSRIMFTDPAKYPARVGTYGGKLVENATQAVARDILGEAIVRLHAAHYQIVAHVHDEIIVRGVGKHSVGVVRHIMNEVPKWAPGLPIASAGFKSRRYRKD